MSGDLLQPEAPTETIIYSTDSCLSHEDCDLREPQSGGGVLPNEIEMLRNALFAIEIDCPDMGQFLWQLYDTGKLLVFDKEEATFGDIHTISGTVFDSEVHIWSGTFYYGSKSARRHPPSRGRACMACRRSRSYGERGGLL